MVRYFKRGYVVIKEQSSFKYFSKSDGSFNDLISKSIAFHDLKQSTFIFPRVKGSNPEERYIEYETLTNIVNIREVYIRFMKGDLSEYEAKKIFSDVGKALADIHKLLKLKNKDLILKNEKFRSLLKRKEINFGKNCAFLHTDYGFSNIFINLDQKICIIDPYANNYTSSNIVNAWGPVEIDIATFLMCLEGLIPFKYLLYLSDKKIDILKKAFLAGYYSIVGYEQDCEHLKKATMLFLNVYLCHRYKSRVFAMAIKVYIFVIKKVTFLS